MSVSISSPYTSQFGIHYIISTKLECTHVHVHTKVYQYYLAMTVVLTCTCN